MALAQVTLELRSVSTPLAVTQQVAAPTLGVQQCGNQPFWLCC
jgi:hypothetical protein